MERTEFGFGPLLELYQRRDASMGKGAEDWTTDSSGKCFFVGMGL